MPYSERVRLPVPPLATKLLLLLPLFVSGVQPVFSLEVRAYSESTHNRLRKFPGQPIFDQIPEVNPGFSPSAGLFRGIGWPAHATDWTRQMALISPRHFVYATHYPLGADWQIAFIGNDGQQHLYGIESQVPIVNSQGQTTDLMLCTLTAPVDTTVGITPFPVLNLPNEAAYTGTEAIVNGSFVRASKMPIAGFTTLVNDPGFDTTRYAYFDYNKNSGAGNDCHYQGGDSGAPGFIMVDGKPALIGTASGLDDLATFPSPQPVFRSYLSFIPAYLSELDAMMNAKGYHVKRCYPATTSVGAEALPQGTLRQLKAGSARIAVGNTGANVAHNVSLRITFSAAPTAVSGTGWICEALSPTVWGCRRGGLNAASSADLTASWNSLPASAAIQVTTLRAYDGAADSTVVSTLPLLQSYASWVQGAANTGTTEDPDRDGIPNLLEYAFGGAPSTASSFATGGHSLLPAAKRLGDYLLVTFPRRTDSAARGITESVEFSTNLPASSWSSDLPAGTIVESSGYSPPSTGFEEVRVKVPIDSGRRFARVKVTLSD